MAELATIARPYAEALFKACADGRRLEQHCRVEELAAIAANPQLRQLADNPNVSDKCSISSRVAKSALPESARNFLRVSSKTAVYVLPEVAAQFRSLVNSKSGSSDAVVTALPD
jgi:F-type H+-transporting ATPase subunit delta